MSSQKAFKFFNAGHVYTTPVCCWFIYINLNRQGYKYSVMETMRIGISFDILLGSGYFAFLFF